MIKSGREALFRYIWGIIKNKNCHLYRINGVEDHLHIVLHLHPSVSLASLVQEIKISSNKYIKEQGIFPDFTSWQEGYGAFTYSKESRDRLIAYVKRQEEHHCKTTSIDEYKKLLEEQGVEYEERFLE
jgi:putative transposase